MRCLNPFRLPGRWYRGVFHCHTTRSDGARSVEAAVAWYGEHGYDFLAITDHNQLTRPEPPGGPPLLLPGTELDVGRTILGEPYHLVGVGLREMVGVPRDAAERHRMPVQEVVDRLRGAGAVVFVAHPYWSGLVVDDLVPLEGVAGIEVYNANTDVDVAKGYSEVHWDDCLSRGKLLWGVANDDAHWRLPDYGRGWTLVRAEALDAEKIVEALSRGAFYASTGVVLEDVALEGEVVSVRVGPPGAREIRFMADRRWGQRVVSPGALLREAAYTLRGHERYVRVEAVGPDGGRAWTNPLLMEV